MKAFFWICERCGTKIDVQPGEATQYRAINYEQRNGDFAVLNAEIRVEDRA